MDDIHDYGEKLKKAEERLKGAGIEEKNKVQIREFVNFKTAQGVKVPRQEKYVRMLRIICERYLFEGEKFEDLQKNDAVRIVAAIERERRRDWTKYDYKVIFKTFLKWLGKEEVVSWIRLNKPRGLPEDLINEVEIQRLIDAAYTLRDKAMIAVLYEGGLRIGELCGLHVKDISFDRYGAIAMVNGKTGMRRVRLIWSMPYLAQWLEIHPKGEERESPMWLTRGSSESLKYPAVRLQLKKIAKRAKIEKRVNPHNFRHSRATHLAMQLTESQMETYLGWVQGSRAPAVYVHMSGRDLDADLLKMYGIEPEKGERDEELQTLQCPHCKTLNTAGARICVNCRKPLAVEEVLEREEKAVELFKDFMDVVAEHPEVMEKFKKHLEEK